MQKFYNAFMFVFILLSLSVAVGQEVDDNETCFECHSDEELVGEIDGEEVSMFVDLKKYEDSVHGFFECVMCHEDIEEIPHEWELEKVDCSIRHEDPKDEVAMSVHRGEKGPNCNDCHGNAHEILYTDNPESLTSRERNLELCSTCHGENASDTMRVESPRMSHPVETYMETVHGKAYINGKTEAAVCSDCHNSHEILVDSDPESSVHLFNVASTCGKCHGEIEEELMSSIHGEALQKGVSDSASCTSCHGEHDIFPIEDMRSTVYKSAVARDTCSDCHGSLRIASRYDIPYGQVDSYYDSYHGLAVRFGSVTAANCASCHGYHHVLASTNPDSMIHPDNLPQTCGKCHAGATEVFISQEIHIDPETQSHWLVSLVRAIYLILIPLTLGGMLLHNAIIFISHSIRKARMSREMGHQRLNIAEILQHMVLAIVFTALVITGFALVFPNSWWVTILTGFGFTEELRGDIHRFSAVIFILLCLWHLAYLIFSKEGRKKFYEMLPTWHDVTDAKNTLCYYLGYCDEKPTHKGFYSYDEKFEYWALLWGSAIMIVSGLVLWFPFEILAYAPMWVVDLARVIHYYEAWLATFAILVWHFFFTIYHPEEYPMNVSWLVGYNVRGEAKPNQESEEDPQQT